jgi:hypothetical protein
MSRTDDEKKKKDKKKRESDLEKMIFAIMEKSMKDALNQAIDDLFRDWQ